MLKFKNSRLEFIISSKDHKLETGRKRDKVNFKVQNGELKIESLGEITVKLKPINVNLEVKNYTTPAIKLLCA